MDESGGGGQPAADGTLVIRGVIANTSDALWNTVACGATKEAQERGVDFEWYASETTDATRLNTNFNAALLDDPQGLLLNAPNVDPFAGQVQTLMRQGVPVASALDMTPPSYVRLFADQAPPQELVDMATEVLSGGGSVFTVGGSAAVPIVANRYEPLLDALEQEEGVTVLPVQFTDFDPNRTQTAVNAAILANPDLKLIIASTGPEGEGAAAAIRSSGRDDIEIIGFDAVPAEVEALRAGTILALGAQPAEEIGRQQLAAIVDYLEEGNTGPVEPIEPVDLPMGLLTQDNVDDPEMAGYIYSNSCDA
ncbi:sugar ABC transporter substrate-binding protein [Trujillonella humicola]|uniref:sugar ABC transporter substrate-binding protein n=1 Tax=Trujillonella humicola TaxID=3383699 RepID=UPI003905CB96